jgi:Putative phage serine protease XkdF
MSEIMPDDVGMDTEIIAALYGPGIDPRELISKMGPDQSELHVNRPLSGAAKKQKKEGWKKKAESSAKFFAGATGVLAGPAAIYTAGKSPALKKAPKGKHHANNPRDFRADPKNAGPGLKGLHRLASPKTKMGRLVRSPKTLAAGAGSAVALQVANMAGDGQVLRDEVKYIKTKVKSKKKVSKKFTPQNLKPANPAGGDQMNAVNGMFKPLKNTGLQPLVQKPQPSIKPMGSLKPTAGLAKPKMPKPAVPATNTIAKPLKPVSSVAKGISDVVWETEISKVDTDRQQVFGWATVTHVDGQEVVDLQDDYIPMEEIEKAAYNYVVSSRKGGDMHARDGDGPKHTADLIESVIFSPEKIEKMGLDPANFPKMGWWLGMKVNDEEQWELVKKGERTGFSIHGKGTRVSKEI